MKKVQITRDGHIVNVHRVCVKLFTGEEITGVVNIADFDCERLSDYFLLQDNLFLIINKCNNKHKTMFINKNHIVWAVPID